MRLGGVEVAPTDPATTTYNTTYTTRVRLTNENQTWTYNDYATQDATGSLPAECIPADHPVVQHILSLIPESLRDAVWLGGSATTCFGEHGDVDAWIGHWDRELTDAEVRACRDIARQPGNTRDHQGDDILDEYPNLTSHMLYAGTAPDGTSIHVMQAVVPMQDVLDQFDISTHAQVVQVANGFLMGPQIALGFTHRPTVVVRNWHHAPTSLTRGIKFAKRYGDDDFWHRESNKRCAADAFGMKLLAPEIVERAELMGLSEGF